MLQTIRNQRLQSLIMQFLIGISGGMYNRCMMNVPLCPNVDQISCILSRHRLSISKLVALARENIYVDTSCGVP